MLVSELMEYPKIKALMKKNWDNDKVSGIWGTISATECLSDAFVWGDAKFDFWHTLNKYDLDICKKEYPEYFIKEEVSKVYIEYLKGWPKLHARAEYILSKVGEVHSLKEAARLYYYKGLASSDHYTWEGTVFWGLIDASNFGKARKCRPELFEVVVPTSSSDVPTDGTKNLDVLGLRPQGSGDLKKVPVAKDLIYHTLTTPDNDPPIVWGYTLTSCDLLPVMKELDDFIEEYELNWSARVSFSYDGSGYLEITGYYKDKDLVGDTGKVILVWFGG